MDNPIELLKQGQYISMVRRGRWEFVQRVNATGIVVVVPLTAEGEVVFVEQYRPPVRASVVEWPAGIAGDVAACASESLQEAARRELSEETGYEARTMTKVTCGPPSPGISDEQATFFVATGLRRVAPGGGDHQEDIAVHVVALHSVAAWLQACAERSVLIDPKIYTGLYFIERMDLD